MYFRLRQCLVACKRFVTSKASNDIMRVLNVAEKNDAAKSLADIMSGGRYQRREGFSRFNKIYEYDYHLMGANCKMTMTSLSGHLLNFEFTGQYKNWNSCPPLSLFDAPVQKQCPQDYQDIKRTLEREVLGAKKLIIWTDCDREGENIGFEVIQVCTAVNPRIEVYRAKFSEITRSAVDRAVQNLIVPDKNTSDAVDVRQELDLRIGAAFTRFQTLRLQKVFPQVLAEQLISYGSCQFPTLGFVVERYKQVEAFVPEPFWKLRVVHETQDGTCEFTWKRNRLFNQLACSVLYEHVLERPLARVEDVKSKPKSRWRPVALDTVELEKLASKKLRINAKETMKIAEKLYTQGYISYPRTETNQFPKDFNLRALVENQCADANWGAFASNLLATGITPRNGNKSDQAHPPIHPTKYTHSLQGNEARVYEFVVRHFLACCSQDAKGHETTIDIDVNGEKFSASGLMIIAKNYLEVYPYDNWNAKVIPLYSVGEEFEPNAIEMNQGETSAPSLLTEADLIALMDKHGIGTDATHADHIETIKSRLYVGVRPDGKFVPGELGMGLVEGYDAMGYEMSKPHLRAELEADLKRICEGRKNKDVVLQEQIAKYREVFVEACRQANKIDSALAVYFGDACEYRETNEMHTSVPVLKCPLCSQDMVLRTKKDGKGFYISCMGYPTCRNAIWLPDCVVQANVLDESCPQCAPRVVNKIQFKFKRTASLPPYIPTEHTACIGGCDPSLNEALSIRLKSPTRPTSGGGGGGENNGQRRRPSTNNSFSDSGYGGSLPGVSKTQNRGYHSVSSAQNTPPARGRGGTGFSASQMTYNSRQRLSGRPPAQPGILGSTIGSTNSRGGNFGQGQSDRGQGQGGRGRGGFGDGSSAPGEGAGGVVTCNCGQDARLLTVRKEGPNCGRQFYACGKGQENSCGFFLWADQNTGTDQGPSFSQQNNNNFQSLTPSSSRSFAENSTDGATVNCNCGTPATLLTVKKEGPNQGRQFYGCPKGHQGCRFFQWSDERGEGSVPFSQSGAGPKSTSRGRGSSGGGSRAGNNSGASGGKIRKCGLCKEEGHDKRNCPNR